MSDKANKIEKVKLDIPETLNPTPKSNMEEYNIPQGGTGPTVVAKPTVVKVAKPTLFQKLVNWLLKKNKGKIIAYLIIALRGIIYPFDVYKVDENGNWEIDPAEQSVKNVKWASQISKLGSLLTFVVAWILNEPIKDFTGKGVIEWIQLLLNAVE